MDNYHFLLEVRDSDGFVTKRRISHSLDAIEDWIEQNAQKWALPPVKVEHDGYGGGKVYVTYDPDCVIFTYSATNIDII